MRPNSYQDGEGSQTLIAIIILIIILIGVAQLGSLQIPSECLTIIIVWIIVGIILAIISSKTKNAPLYNKKVTTSLSRDQVLEIAKNHFPKSIISKSFNWEFLRIGDHRFELKGYYLTNSQGCLTLLVTGIIPGFFLIQLFMERSEKVTIDFSDMETSGRITLEAKGLRARQELDGLTRELAQASWLAKLKNS